jgi:hypothetical protein
VKQDHNNAKKQNMQEVLDLLWDLQDRVLKIYQKIDELNEATEERKAFEKDFWMDKNAMAAREAI